MPEPPADVWTDPRFSAVGAAFAENLATRDEVGAALTVIAGRRVVVRAVGGWQDSEGTVPWQRDTLVNGFSTGKAWVAVVALRAVEAGALDLDQPLRAVWPDLDGEGRERVTLRHVLSHQAGLPGVREPLAEGTQYDWTSMCAAIARTDPWWPPGTAHGYHVNTFGFLVGEAVRRTTGATIRQAVSEIAEIVGADLHVGAPLTAAGRVAEFRWPSSTPPEQPPPADPGERLQWAAYVNPPGLSGMGVINSEAWRSAEIPSANGHTTALGLAAFYANLLWSSRLLPPALLQHATEVQSGGEDRVLGRPSRFGLGFQLTQPERPFGTSAAAFGHFGAGGSLGFADPEADVAFGYVTASMGPRWQNPRNRALLDALGECLA